MGNRVGKSELTRQARRPSPYAGQAPFVLRAPTCVGNTQGSNWPFKDSLTTTGSAHERGANAEDITWHLRFKTFRAYFQI